MTTNTETRTSWQLARMAGCADPDEHDGRGSRDGSAGAQFLRSIEYSVADYDSPDEDTAHEIADGAVPVYTHELWKTFVDLAAYTEDPSELGYDDASDMEKLAGACLYLIGRRLAEALIEELETDEDEDEDEDEDA
jgi:hypothetical protein